MSSTEVRPFRRSDREQLTALVNAHAGAVVPGMSASASTVLSALERKPGEFIEDPWVSERITLVAVQDDRSDVSNLQVAEACRRQGVATWLLGQAADWLRLARVDRLLDYAWLQGTDPGGLDYASYRAFLPAARFREITRTRRGWSRAALGTGHH